MSPPLDPSSISDERLLSPKEVSAWTQVTEHNLAQLRYTGKGPRYRRLTPRTIRYLASDIRVWLEESARTGTA